MMKRPVALLFMLFILTACWRGSIAIPETDHSYTIFKRALRDNRTI